MSDNDHSQRLNAVIEALEGREDLNDFLTDSLAVFLDMRERDDFPLSDKQIGWVEKVADQLDVELPRAQSNKPVPRGAEVEMLFKKGPLKPPTRKKP